MPEMAAMSKITTTFAQLTQSGALSVTDGYRAKNSELGGTGLIFLRAGHVTDTYVDFAGVELFHDKLTPKLKDKTSRIGDVIVTTKGNSTGRTSFVDAKMPTFVYSPHLSRWRVEDPNRIDSGFLRYWSRSAEFVNQMRGLAASTDMAPYLSLRDQQRLKITLPHMDDQRAIGAVLGSLDDKIEQNRRTGRKLEELARAVFKAWFVDFGPVKAKAAGATAFPGMPPETFATLPNTLKDSPLGPVPEGWKIGTLPQFAEVNYGKNLPATKLTQHGITVYGAAGMVGYYSEVMFTFPIVLITSRGSGSGTIHETFGPAFVTNNSFSIVPRDDWFSRHFLKFWLRSIDVLARVTGSAQPQLTISNLQNLEVLNPEREILLSFHSIVDPLWELANANRNESAKLATLRDYLLPRLLSGRVRISDVEQPVRLAVQTQ